MKDYHISKINVEGNKVVSYEAGGIFKITQEFIDDFPSGNGDITSLLKINPNVQFSNSYQSSKTPGEIDPANISINGAAFYQNLFNLDGISMNNDLDPASNNPNSITDIPGRSQGISIDSSLIEKIEVYDSNVSASYGGFEGGVINVTTKNPSKNFSAKLSYQTTSSAQTKYHLYESDNEVLLNSSDSSNEPYFFKQFIRANLSGYLGKHFGIIGSFSSVNSTIPLKEYIPSYKKQIQKNQYRNIYNYFLKTTYDGIENLNLSFSLTYAPQNNQYFIKNAKNSEFSILSGGLQGSLKATYNFKSLTFVNNLSYSELKNSKKSQENYFKGWKYSEEKDWGTPGKGSNEGAWGNIKTIQRTIEYKSDLKFEEFEIFKTYHLISTGLVLDFGSSYYQRLEDTFSGSSLSAIKEGGICAEKQYCSNSPVQGEKSSIWKNNAGQYFKWLNVYKAGKINLDNFGYGFYLQDDLRIWRLSFRPGLRISGDTYMKKITLAPRVALAFDVFGNKNTNIIVGINRYYGRNLLAYRLYDGRTALQSTYKRTNEKTTWDKAIISQQKNNTQFNRLKIPYNDEFVVGITQRFWQFEGNLKYIHRNGKDEITKVSSKIASLPKDPDYTTLYYTYTNDGKSVSDIITLSFSTIKPIEFFNIKQSFLFGADYSNIKKNYNDYASSLNSNAFNDVDVIFDGKIIKYNSLPPNDFNKPYSLTFTTISQIKISTFDLTWTNFFAYKSGYKSIAINGVQTSSKGEELDNYQTFDFPNTFNWDARIGLKKNLWGKNMVFIYLDIFNVFDNLNIISAKTETIKKKNTALIPTYQTGRSFYIQVGYEF
ncbi:TonB-dependent receptor plug domain-containing protein [Helicobacter cappadocius]|uniref:TonB-dependent receptor n=1 Tax=Helicobacter cappadocius TaxID=3063998 RepID=A0ABT8Z295_9HELI|nr:TonB-dependent receptor [Helicobacter sp. faydin-H75]MDO7252470.1 TonB-dependent receptor [Helicobacter sp. faydin-H75]